ncbi:MAG: integrase core domain-containing protein [Alphaproteobacteria bacterium]
MIACQFLRDPIDAFPYRPHTVLTDNRVQFRHPPRYRDGPTAKFAGHPFERICAENRIEHRLIKPNHPWTNGQVERTNRTIKDATVRHRTLSRASSSCPRGSISGRAKPTTVSTAGISG